jgi:hypothetical protein
MITPMFPIDQSLREEERLLREVWLLELLEYVQAWAVQDLSRSLSTCYSTDHDGFA